MDYSLIEVEYRGRVGILRLNRPSALNAMSVKMTQEIIEALPLIESSARALVIMGAGRAFSAGGDLEAFPEGSPDVDMGLILETHVNPFMTQLRDLSIPWITAVHGAAAGMGCSLALAADMIVASENAYFLQAFSGIGLVPDGGSSYLLTRTLGRPRAMEMMLLGERIGAAKALEWGLINRMVSEDQLEAEALSLAERLANGPKSLSQTRRLVW
ncbi:MAG: enoyl-CoA hydratase-related protein, partial [Tabrizicola sp.]|nr:enoyl-CoA hydratase-related protein [Tabrizicola sp.]